MKEVSLYLLVCFIVGCYLGFSLGSGTYAFSAALGVVVTGWLLGLLLIAIANQWERLKAKFARQGKDSSE